MHKYRLFRGHPYPPRNVLIDPIDRARRDHLKSIYPLHVVFTYHNRNFARIFFVFASILYSVVQPRKDDLANFDFLLTIHFGFADILECSFQTIKTQFNFLAETTYGIRENVQEKLAICLSEYLERFQFDQSTNESKLDQFRRFVKSESEKLRTSPAENLPGHTVLRSPENIAGPAQAATQGDLTKPPQVRAVPTRRCAHPCPSRFESNLAQACHPICTAPPARPLCGQATPSALPHPPAGVGGSAGSFVDPPSLQVRPPVVPTLNLPARTHLPSRLCRPPAHRRACAARSRLLLPSTPPVRPIQLRAWS